MDSTGLGDKLLRFFKMEFIFFSGIPSKDAYRVILNYCSRVVDMTMVTFIRQKADGQT